MHVLGDLESGPLVGQGQLGLRTPAHEGHHPVADFEPGRLGSGRHHLACELHPGDVGRDPCRSGVEAAALEQVSGIESGRADGHEQLVIAGDGVRMLDPLEPASVGDRDGAHAKP